LVQQRVATVVLAVAAVLKGLELVQPRARVFRAKVLRAVRVLRQPTVAAVAAVRVVLGLLEPVGHHEDLPALGLVMVDWASKAQSTARQHLMAAAAVLV
jgi:hypothetical protein